MTTIIKLQFTRGIWPNQHLDWLSQRLYCLFLRYFWQFLRTGSDCLRKKLAQLAEQQAKDTEVQLDLTKQSVANSLAQNGVMLKSAADANQNASDALSVMRLQMRASVTPTILGTSFAKTAEDIAANGEYIEVTMKLENTGSTPSNNVRINISQRLRLLASLNDLYWIESFHDYDDLGLPVSLASRGYEEISKSISPDTRDIDSFYTNKDAYLIIGEIKYDDIFGTAHTWDFCFLQKHDDPNHTSQCGAHNKPD